MREVVINDARLIFRNFAGKRTEYNAEGRRNFCVVLDNEIAQKMADDGWNVKWPKTVDPDRDPLPPYIQVAVRFDNYPPAVYLVTSRGKTRLDEDTVSGLDWAEIEKVDLKITGSQWQHGNKTGIKAYLKSMFVTIVEDELEMRYADIPDATYGGELND